MDIITVLGQKKSISRDPNATRRPKSRYGQLELAACTTPRLVCNPTIAFLDISMFSLGVLAAVFTLFLPPLVGGAATNTTRTIVTPGNSHSLPETYQFDPRDGWESVIVTNMRYKYRRSSTPFRGTTSTAAPGKNSSSPLKRPSSTKPQHSTTKNVFRSVGASIVEFTKGIIGIGKAEEVVITWFDSYARSLTMHV